YQPGQKAPIYTQNITPKEPGIVALTIPDAVSPLKVGTPYYWSVSMRCSPTKSSEIIYTKAWIERVKDSRNSINKSSCSSNYAQSGIWYDALFCQSKSNQGFWSLLDQIQLSAIAEKQPNIYFINQQFSTNAQKPR
ncbi:MAG: DUF928 domain-containing protein, partial [Waterburya sp.]